MYKGLYQSSLRKIKQPLGETFKKGETTKHGFQGFFFKH